MAGSEPFFEAPPVCEGYPGCTCGQTCTYCGGPHLSRDCPDEQDGMATDYPLSVVEIALGVTIGVVAVGLLAMLFLLAFGHAAVCP